MKNSNKVIIRFLLKSIPDKLYIKLKYRYMIGEKINLKKPQKFNEKLQFLKLYDRKEIYAKMVDKCEAKNLVSQIIGSEYVIPTLGVYNSFDEIDFNVLPNQFVIKCTHDSGGLVIVRDKYKLDIEDAKNKINSSLKRNYYYLSREWPYKNVKPRIIIEQYMEDKIDKELIDYKFYCFNGKCDYVMACFDRSKNDVKFMYYDRNWNLKKNFSNDGLKYGNSVELRKPNKLEKMFEIAEKLSKNIPFVRIDLYNINGKIYMGEYTFFPSGGFDTSRTKDIEQYLNNSLIVG